MKTMNSKHDSPDVKVGDFVTLKWLNFNNAYYKLLTRDDDWENIIGLVVNDCYEGDPEMLLVLIEEKSIPFRKAQLDLYIPTVGIDF